MRRSRRRTLFVVAGLHALAAFAGVVAGWWLTRELPGVSGLDLLRLPQMTILLDQRGGRLHSFAEQRRTPVTLDQISPLFLKALLATEDPRFYRHVGVDLRAISRAAWATLTSLHWGVQGGSTLTQQLARDQFLYPRKTLHRKLQEMILAISLERQYTKREILELYCNRIYLGHGRYGVEAAAQFYFGKRARDLTLPEAALLAGLPQRPEGYSPIKSPARASARRTHVLNRMVEERMLSPAAAAEAVRAPLGVVAAGAARPLAAYFVEDVRRFLLKEFGEELLYRSGLVARTTLDPRLQHAAERAVRAGLDEYGRRHRIMPIGRPPTSGQAGGAYSDPSWRDAFSAGDIVPALVESVAADRAEVRIGADALTLTARDVAWTGRRTLPGLLTVGQLHPVKVLQVDARGRPTRVELAADPPVEVAFLALDPQTGDVLALVGGRDFDRSEFDRSLQAARQAGSAFKPFVYAAALEHGLGPTQLLWDVPTVLLDSGSPAPYQPENYDGAYEGLVTAQHALEQSRNIPTVRLLDAIGYGPVVDLGQRFGLRADLKPYPSLALGAFEVRLVDLVAAYAAFVNGGVLMTPRLVRTVQGAAGQELWTARTEAREVLAPEIACQLTAMLEGVTLRGTGAQALSLNRPTIGKTGTTDDFTDAWFIGGTPSLIAGVWVGHDQRQTLGRGETGARAALPIWIQFMGEALAGRPAEEFPRPAGVQQVVIDLATGLRAQPEAECRQLALAPLPTRRPPPASCTTRAHQRTRLPYPLQRFGLRPDGALLIPPAEAARLAALAPDRFELHSARRELIFQWAGLSGAIPLAWSGPDWTRALSDLSRYAALKAAGQPLAQLLEGGPLRYGPWRGRDGWFVEVLEVNRSGQVRPPTAPLDP